MKNFIGIKRVLSFVFFSICAQSSLADCSECWEPHLSFDIEGKGFMSSMIFISGHSYSLSEVNRLLNNQGKESFFCKKGVISSKELIEILNKTLSGIVTAEQVTSEISKGLIAKYPCERN